MVEAALDKMMMGAAAAAPEDNLLIDTGGGGDNLSAPAAMEANDEYEETTMNPNGFFSEDSDQVSWPIRCFALSQSLRLCQPQVA